MSKPHSKRVREARARLNDLDGQTEAARADYRLAVMLLNEAELAFRAQRNQPDSKHYRASG